MEPSRADDEFERQKKEDGQEIERGLVSENSVRLDTFKREDSLSIVYLGCSVGGDVAKRIRQHGDEDGKEESVAKESKCDHDDGSQQPVEFHL